MATSARPSHTHGACDNQRSPRWNHCAASRSWPESPPRALSSRYHPASKAPAASAWWMAGAVEGSAKGTTCFHMSGIRLDQREGERVPEGTRRGPGRRAHGDQHEAGAVDEAGHAHAARGEDVVEAGGGERRGALGLVRL